MAATTLTLRNTKGSPLTNTEMDTNISLLNSYSKGYLSKSITTSVSLTDAEADNYFFAISGTLSADATITIPSILVKSWTVHNGTTGGFNVTFKYATGAGITIQNGTRSTFYFDGTDMQSISYSNTVRISDTGTVTSTMILDGTILNGDINAAAAIAITKLAASTISGISLGNNLNALTMNNLGAGSASGTTFNGSAVQTISYNTIGASPTAGSSSLTTVGTLTSGSIGSGFTAIANSALANSSITINGSTVSLGGTVSINAGAIITDDTSTNINQYLGMSRIVSGAWLNAYTASTKLFFNPNTGTTYSTIFQSLSDKNKKTNINNIENALDIVENINGVTFDWIDSGLPSAGLIAQDVEKYLPELVTENEGTKSLNYNGVIGVLVEAIKELSEKIRVLESK
jgi:hypothetical protein